MSRYINVAGIILAVLNAVLANERTYLVFLASATWAALSFLAPVRSGVLQRHKSPDRTGAAFETHRRLNRQPNLRIRCYFNSVNRSSTSFICGPISLRINTP